MARVRFRALSHLCLLYAFIIGAYLLIGFLLKAVVFAATKGAQADAGTALLMDVLTLLALTSTIMIIHAGEIAEWTAGITMFTKLPFTQLFPPSLRNVRARDDREAITQLRAASSSMFFHPEDACLFEAAQRHWVENGGEPSVIERAAVSAEARGRIIGAFLDAHPGEYWISAEGMESFVMYKRGWTFPFFDRQLLVPGGVLLIGLALRLMYMGAGFHQAGSPNDNEQMFLLGLNYVFGALWSGSQLHMQIGFGACVLMAVGIYKNREAKWSFVCGVLLYLLASLHSLGIANEQWDSNQTVKNVKTGFGVFNWVLGGIPEAISAMLDGLSLSGIFGFSAVFWSVAAARAIYAACISSDGRMYYNMQMERPALFGRLDNAEK